MRSYDLYGTPEADLQALRTTVEQALGLELAPHESWYMGGEYFLGKGPDSEEFVLRSNIDLDDNAPAEDEFPEARTLLEVAATIRSEEIAERLRAIPRMVLLRHEEL